jgi:hypothetical protein
MIVSLNEIETMVHKAARGAGLPWGLAEEAAQAARWLARQGLPFETPLASLLASQAWRANLVLDGTHLRPRSDEAWLCPIRAGAWLSDLGDIVPVRIDRVLWPILLLPFAARCACPVELAFAGVLLLTGAATFAIRQGDLAALRQPKALRVEVMAPASRDLEQARLLRPEGRVEVNMTGWSKLQSFEALTYVPASLESRLTGAGAAQSDND